MNSKCPKPARVREAGGASSSRAVGGHIATTTSAPAPRRDDGEIIGKGLPTGERANELGRSPGSKPDREGEALIPPSQPQGRPSATTEACDKDVFIHQRIDSPASPERDAGSRSSWSVSPKDGASPTPDVSLNYSVSDDEQDEEPSQDASGVEVGQAFDQRSHEERGQSLLRVLLSQAQARPAGHASKRRTGIWNPMKKTD